MIDIDAGALVAAGGLLIAVVTVCVFWILAMKKLFK